MSITILDDSSIQIDNGTYLLKVSNRNTYYFQGLDRWRRSGVFIG